MTTTTGHPAHRGGGIRAAANWPLIALAAVLGYGVWAYTDQLSSGLGVTGMRDIQIWGAYIAFFMFLVGVSAGALLVSSIAAIVHAPQASQLLRHGTWVSLATIMVAGLSIFTDLGEPQRFWHMFAYANWTSPMIWELIALLAYAAMNIMSLWVQARRQLAARGSWLAFCARAASGEADTEAPAQWLAYLGVLFAFALLAIDAFVISTHPSHPYWYSTAMGPLFVTSGLCSGIAAVLIVTWLLGRTGRAALGEPALRWLAGSLVIAILLNFFVLIVEVITTSEGRVLSDWGALSLVTLGSYAWIFWAEVGIGIVALALVFTPRARAVRPIVLLASWLVLASIAFERIQLIVGGFVNPNVDAAPGISLGTPAQLNMVGSPTGSSFTETANYAPSWVEWSVVIGLAALWVLLLVIGFRLVPLGRARRRPESVSAAPEGAARPVPAGAGAATLGAGPADNGPVPAGRASSPAGGPASPARSGTVVGTGDR